MRAKSMSPARFTDCLFIIGWTQRGIGKKLGRSEQNIRQMVSGAVRIPDDVASWIERLAIFHEHNKPPQRNIITD
jgi:DNA-binding transcriptional regulator YdaS (Cro superfamily)